MQCYSKSLKYIRVSDDASVIFFYSDYIETDACQVPLNAVGAVQVFLLQKTSTSDKR